MVRTRKAMTMTRPTLKQGHLLYPVYATQFLHAVDLLLSYMNVVHTDIKMCRMGHKVFTLPLVCFFFKLLFNRLLFCESSLNVFQFNSIFIIKLSALSN